MANNICFRKTYETENGRGKATLSFTFYGNGKKANREEKSELLDKCFKKMTTYRDVRKIVKFIRTVLKDFEEEYLSVTVKNAKEEIKVEYKNKQLVYYIEETNLENGNTFTTIYSTPFNIHSFVSGQNKKNLANIEYTEMLKDTFKNSISTLENYEVKEELYPSEQHICDLYKLFYGQNPDFTKVETDTKTQAMFYILNYFCLDFSYDFDTPFEGSLFPCSLKLMQELKDLIPLGKMVIDEKEIKIQDFQKRQVKMIGEKVRKEIQNDIIALMQFCKVLHEDEKQLRYVEEADYNKIAESTELEIAEVLENIELARKIEKETDKIKK